MHQRDEAGLFAAAVCKAILLDTVCETSLHLVGEAVGCSCWVDFEEDDFAGFGLQADGATACVVALLIDCFETFAAAVFEHQVQTLFC